MKTKGISASNAFQVRLAANLSALRLVPCLFHIFICNYLPRSALDFCDISCKEKGDSFISKPEQVYLQRESHESACRCISAFTQFPIR